MQDISINLISWAWPLFVAMPCLALAFLLYACSTNKKEMEFARIWTCIAATLSAPIMMNLAFSSTNTNHLYIFNQGEVITLLVAIGVACTALQYRTYSLTKYESK